MEGLIIMSKKSVNETLDHILKELERMSYEVWVSNDEFKSSQWYDKWEHDNHFVDGSADGFQRAINEIEGLIYLIKREEGLK